jgi:hypothetical protein
MDGARFPAMGFFGYRTRKIIGHDRIAHIEAVFISYLEKKRRHDIFPAGSHRGHQHVTPDIT